MEVIQENQQTNVNKELRIAQCEENCRRQYEILQGIDAQDQENKTNKRKAIQILAREMEEIMILRGQDKERQYICRIICNNLQKLGLSRGMYEYPFECLEAKYKHFIDHSTVQPPGSPGDPIEESSIYEGKVQAAIHLLENFNFEQCRRGKVQDFAERINKIPAKIYDGCKERNIATYEENKDYKSPPDQYQETIRYPKTKPARTVFTEAIERHMKAWEHVLKRVILEGKDPKTDKLFMSDEALLQCADGLDQMTNLLKPITDRKYRKNWLQWYYIVKHAHQWFKHSAAKKFEVKDFEAFLRSLTREQIGFRMTKEGSMTFDQVVKFFIGYFRIYTIWYPQVAEPLGAQFSRWLHPKLSNRS